MTTTGHRRDSSIGVLRSTRRAAGIVAAGPALIALPLVLILGAVRFAFSWQPVYTYAVETYHADEVTGVGEAELLRATHSIRTYFADDRRDLDITVHDAGGKQEPLFNQQEIAHMRDVKALVQRVYLLLDLAVAYLVLYAAVSLAVLRRPLSALARRLLPAALLTALLITAAGLASFLDFDQLFTEFHVLSFSNGFWQLDPTRDHLVQIFPQGFWYDITLFVGLLALTAAAMLAVLSGTYLLLHGRARKPVPRSAATVGLPSK